MARTNFLIYFSSRRMLDALRDDQLGRVIRAAMNYAEYGAEPSDLDQSELIAYESLRGAILRDIEKYEEKCARLRENGTKGGRPKAEKRKNQIEKKPQNAPETQKPNQGATSTSTSTTTSTSRSTAAVTRACAREDAPDGAPPPLPIPERFFLENGLGRSLSPFIQKQLDDFRADGMEDELLLYAMQEAASNSTGWAYARAILERCRTDGIRTLAENEQRRRPKGSGRNTVVDRAQPSGNDFLAAAASRPRRLKRKD